MGQPQRTGPGMQPHTRSQTMMVDSAGGSLTEELFRLMRSHDLPSGLGLGGEGIAVYGFHTV